MKLLTTENAKTAKGQNQGYLTGILYLAPHNIAGYGSICPKSIEGCRASCLYSAGRGVFSEIQEARIIKTIHFFENRQGFIEQLHHDIAALKIKADKLGLTPCVRLNGTSDIDGQTLAPSLFIKNRDVQFYDYTKDFNRIQKFDNYDLSYSLSEETKNVNFDSLPSRAVQVYKGNLPLFDRARLVINGDDSDLRFLDPKDCIVGVLAKGEAKKDLTGFVKEYI